jgi:hypothetical protein
MTDQELAEIRKRIETFNLFPSDPLALLAEIDRLKALVVWCDQHMRDTIPPLPDFSGPDDGWQEMRLKVQAAARDAALR